MKPEQSERFYIEELFAKTQDKGVLKEEKLEEIDKLTGDASTRRYYRLFTNKDSYVVCLDNPFDGGVEKHPFVSVQQFLFEKGLRVPKILDSSLGRGYILEEDLGDVTFLQHISTFNNKKEELDVYKKVIDQLLVLHRITHQEVNNPHLFQMKFDYTKLMDETKFTFKYFLNFWLKNTDQTLTDDLEKLFHPICERLAAEKMVITHRDFHSRNIMVKSDELIFIDFQDARWGIPQYDLVSLLEDCYYDIEEGNRQYLKKYYYENLSKDIHGQKTYEQFEGLYNDMTLQRVFKAVGSFCYIYNWRKDDRYLKYIGFAMEKIRKILMSDPRYNDLKKILFKYYYAN
ncbi:MAG: aminoglycoside phosphotransferase family protein [Bacteriovoracaceae bacterium]|jgi:aminoglycoside/choline kinase family phosphotransferase